MNSLYISVLKMNAGRYIRCNIRFFVVLTGCIWFFGFNAGLNVTGTNADGVAVAIVAITFLMVLMVSGTFWQNGWSVGDVDLLTGLQTGKYRANRLFLHWLSSLPLSRSSHYRLQLLMYLFVCGSISLTSFLFQLLYPFGREHLALSAYVHLWVFILLIVGGGYQVTVSLPYTYRNRIDSFRSPIIIRGLLAFLAIMMLMNIGDNLYDYLNIGTVAEIVVFIVSTPFILISLLFASGLLFLLGEKRFVESDIR